MTAFPWIEGVGGDAFADGKRLEAVAYGPPPGQAPTIVMLHEASAASRSGVTFRKNSRPRPGTGCSPIRGQAMAGPIRSVSRVHSIT